MPGAVVLVIDGLGAKHLGPYGNTWIETPAFNRLATESMLIDGLYTRSTDRSETYEAWCCGDDRDLLSDLNEKLIPTQLFSDEEELFDYPFAARFAQQDKIEPARGLKLAHEWDDTHAAQFFAQAIQAIEAAPPDSLLWLHTRGLRNPWDAPYRYRQNFVDEEDPDPSGSAQVPSLKLDADYDPDTLHEIQCAYAGQIMLIDRCMAVLHAVIRERAAKNETLFIVSATSGFPLGEHLQVGWKDPELLYHESLSLPAFVRYPGGDMGMKRRGGIVEFSELGEVLRDWMLKGEMKSQFGDRQFAVCRAGERLLLRTPSWHVKFCSLTDDHDQDIAEAELYLKPDDQNEVNDVSDRCESVVEAGREFLRNWLANGSPDSEPVPDILLEPLE